MYVFNITTCYSFKDIWCSDFSSKVKAIAIWPLFRGLDKKSRRKKKLPRGNIQSLQGQFSVQECMPKILGCIRRTRYREVHTSNHRSCFDNVLQRVWLLMWLINVIVWSLCSKVCIVLFQYCHFHLLFIIMNKGNVEGNCPKKCGTFEIRL